MNDKDPFTDKRIGSLLADIIKTILNSDDVSFKEGSDYKWSITFEVKEDYLVLRDNSMVRILVDE